MDPGWWAGLGPGRVEVREPLAPEAWARYFAEDPEVELDLGRTVLGHRVLDLRARRQRRLVRVDDEVVADLDLSGAPDLSGGWDRPVTVLGLAGRAVLETDRTRPSRWRGALRYLRVTAADRAWVWHYEGGRTAGERLVLVRGEAPGAGPALVTTDPSGRGRSLGNPRNGATADIRVLSWGPGASPADVLVAELCAMSGLHGLVDYRPARVAEGVGELLDLAPRPEANTE